MKTTKLSYKILLAVLSVLCVLTFFMGITMLSVNSVLAYGESAIGEFTFPSNLNNRTHGGQKILVINCADQKGDSVKLDCSVNATSAEKFNSALWLYYDGEIYSGSQSGVTVNPTKMVAFSGSIVLSYALDASFIGATEERPAMLVIPSGTVLFNVVFEGDFIAYFYDGAWSTTISHTVANDLLSMQSGAEMRMGANLEQSGIRFVTNVNYGVETMLDGMVASGDIKGYAYGTIIVPYDYLTEISDPTHATLETVYGYYDVPSTIDGGNCFKGALVDLRKENIDRQWIGRGYVKIIDKNDDVVYYYAKFVGESEDLIAENARSVYQIALSVYGGKEELDLDDYEIDIVKTYIDGVVLVNSDGTVVDKGLDYDEPYTVRIVENKLIITMTNNVTSIKSVVVDGKWVKADFSADGFSAIVSLA